MASTNTCAAESQVSWSACSVMGTSRGPHVPPAGEPTRRHEPPPGACALGLLFEEGIKPAPAVSGLVSQLLAGWHGFGCGVSCGCGAGGDGVDVVSVGGGG